MSGPRLLVMAAAALCAAAPATARAQTPKLDSEDTRPSLGTQLSSLPVGPGKAVADNTCLRCHSADILRQQRPSLGRRGPEDKKAELVANFSSVFCHPAAP